MVQNSSGSLAVYGQGGTVGLQPGQSMFADDGTGAGILAARNSFVSMLNIILARTAVVADRTQVASAFTQETPVDQYLIWRQQVGVSSVEALPPATEFDEHVYTLQERDALLADPAITNTLDAGGRIRVLVDGLGNQDAPQWSVWTAKAIAGSVEGSHDYEFTLTKSYDYHVETLHDRDTLLLRAVPPAVGERVLVDGDVLTDGFWTIWQYTGNATWKLVRHQTYRTQDFWSYTDWYAVGYSPTNPPVVRYANAKARDVAENPNPKTTFVRVNDDGNGSWVWTAYVDGKWTVVARQSGTIQLSSKLYDKVRPQIGFDPIQASDLINFSTLLSKVPDRDGGWELRQLMSAIRDQNCLTDLEINELFFSMVHFCHAQQDQVTWAFKTSFLNIGGYNETLQAVPVQPVDNTQNLLNYIDEVKPYRVKTREFTRVVTPPIESTAVRVTDFDFPPYFDPNTGKYRTLSIGSPADLAIIQNNYPWKDWYDNYQKPEWRADNYDANTWNPVRHFRIRMFFDRIDHMPLVSTTRFDFQGGLSTSFGVDIDLSDKIVVVRINDVQVPHENYGIQGTTVTLVYPPDEGDIIEISVHAPVSVDKAAYRIQQFYNPADSDAAEKNIRTLLGLDPKHNVFDGGTMGSTDNDYDYGIIGGDSTEEVHNPNESYYGLGDPANDANRPEELVALKIGEGLTMADKEQGWMIAMAKPSFDTMSPELVGDYDARALDILEYDSGFVSSTSEIQPKARVLVSVQTPDGSPVPADQLSPGQDRAYFTDEGEERTTNYMAPGSFEVLDLSVNTTVLADVYANSTSITVADASVLTGPTLEQIEVNGATATEITHPGVVWINGERIEYFKVEGNVLSELRRGTYNTRMGVEQVNRNLSLANTAVQGDGSNKVFLLAGETSSVGLVVAVHEVARYPSGEIISSDGYTGFPTLVGKTSGIDYTPRVVSGGVEVVFNKAPAVGSYVFLRMTKSIKHPASSTVYDGRAMLANTAIVFY
jgi:hypothetical protein